MADFSFSRDSAISTLRILGGCTALGLATCAQAAPAFDSESPYMLGDWNGTRTELAEKGYDFKLDYTGEMGSNLHGGYDHDRTRVTATSSASARTWTCRRSSAGTPPSFS